MTMFYTITAGKRTAGLAKGPVRAVETVGAGHAAHLNKETGKLCVPHDLSVRECLPHYWRKAWDRSARSSFTFISEIGEARHHSCYKPLHNSKGRYITTIYAAPFYA